MINNPRHIFQVRVPVVYLTFPLALFPWKKILVKMKSSNFSQLFSREKYCWYRRSHEMPLAPGASFHDFLGRMKPGPEKRVPLRALNRGSPFLWGHPLSIGPIRKRHTESRLSNIDTVPEMKSYYDGG
ncbi:hypothetical protein CEXT_629901 [Caerostris extrusa]|uniref:Uncharacterized protein n=1 Tax=Caerostris extrusa TaxID=172846 RepID=A0AAV4MSW3_CAEEX|nr:hypothetical protein CEXT_629901 [Caerostris extrusa]